MPADRVYQPAFILALAGVGKTELALEIARQLPCEIISGASAMVYRNMKIGTAASTPEPYRTVPVPLDQRNDLSVMPANRNLCQLIATSNPFLDTTCWCRQN